jgi:hypothetical protein
VVCPPEFISVPMLATLGAAIGNSYNVAVFVFADPGSKKSFASSKAYIPARHVQPRPRRRDESLENRT